MARTTPASPADFQFEFLGWENGWYALRVPTRAQPGLQVHALEGEIIEWLMEQDIVLNDEAYLANGNTGDGPVVPAFRDGFALCLLLKHPTDVLRFEMQFACRGLTPQRLMEAIRAEASVHRFVTNDIVTVAYAAVHQFERNFGDVDFPEWDDLETIDQDFFRQVIREYMEKPERSAEQQHEAWLDRRRLEGWKYAPEVDLDSFEHPDMVPWKKLPEREQAKTRLIASVVRDLAPMLRR